MLFVNCGSPGNSQRNSFVSTATTKNRDMAEQPEIPYKYIIKRLIGSIHPVGETNTDNANFESLKQQCELIQSLLHDVKALIPLKEHSAYSIKRAGEYAEKFINEFDIDNI